MSALDDLRRPPGRGRVIALAGVGYAYLVLIAAVALTLVGLCVWGVVSGHPLLLKLAIPFVAFLYVFGRSLVVTVLPPSGIAVEPHEAPALWQHVEELRRKVGGRRVDRLQIDDQVNASIAEVPRFGLLGWSRSYLTIGLPLLQALSPDELTAVVAHELGHLSSRHGRFGAWVYRTRARWHQLLETLREKESLAFYMLLPVFAFVVPRFDAATLAMSRAHELEADDSAASIVGTETTADALVAVSIADQAADLHWADVWSNVDREPRPTQAHALGLASALLRARREDAPGGTPEIEAESDEDDTHPSLGDRLRALGQDPSAVLARRRAPERTAAEAFLDGLASRLDHDFAAAWVSSVSQVWSVEHRRIVGERERLSALDARPQGSLDPRELLELARLRTAYAPETVGDLWEQVLARLPREPEANLMRGAELIAAGNDDGLDLLARAVELDEELELDAIVIAIRHLNEHDRADEIDGWVSRLGGRVGTA